MLMENNFAISSTCVAEMNHLFIIVAKSSAFIAAIFKAYLDLLDIFL